MASAPKRQAEEMSTHEVRPTKRPCFGFSFQSTVEILVGPMQKKFIVHTDLLSACNPFFKANFERWQTLEEPLRLPEDEERVFELYLQAVHFDQIAYLDRALKSPSGTVHWKTKEGPGVDSHQDTKPGERPALPAPEDISQRICAEIFLCLTKAYIFADKCRDLRSANVIIDKIIQFSHDSYKLIDTHSIKYAFGKQPESSPLRRLCVDFYVHESYSEDFECVLDHCPGSFTRAVTREYRRLATDTKNGVRLVERVFNQRVSRMGRCHYHQHDDEHPKCE